MSKLEDLLGKKKEVVPILDLSKTILNSQEEYKRMSEKVPDYKMRPIKVGQVYQHLHEIATGFFVSSIEIERTRNVQSQNIGTVCNDLSLFPISFFWN